MGSVHIKLIVAIYSNCVSTGEAGLLHGQWALCMFPAMGEGGAMVEGGGGEEQ